MYFYNKLIWSHKCEYYLLKSLLNVKHFNWYTYHSYILLWTNVVHLMTQGTPTSYHQRHTLLPPWRGLGGLEVFVVVDRQDRPNFATMLAQVDARCHGGTPTVPCYFAMPMRGRDGSRGIADASTSVSPS
jgi:hypothetical protein